MDLDPFSPEPLDAEDASIVSGNETEGSDDQVASSDLEEFLPRCAVRTVKANLLKDNILVEVNSVEATRIVVSYKWLITIWIEEAHAMSSKNQHPQVPMRILAWRHSEK